MKSYRITSIVICIVIEVLSISLYPYYVPAASTKKDHSEKEFLVTISSRAKVKQKFIIIKPENPSAMVVLFAGGHGNLQLSSSFGSSVIRSGYKANFLVRSRKLFANYRFVVAVLDAPSDQKNMSASWRMSAEHAEDVKGVIQALKKDFNLPLWLIGTSRGTYSASNAAIRLCDEVDGLVLCSSVTYVRNRLDHYSTHPKGILSMDLDAVKVPTLIVAHKEDRCVASPPTNAKKLKDALGNAAKVELKIYTGGKPPKDDRGCIAWGAHSYYGLEDKVVSDIADFIKSN